jgi:hypothetical protein
MSQSDTRTLFWIREPQPGHWEIDVARAFPRSHTLAALLGCETDAPADADFGALERLPAGIRERLAAWLGPDPGRVALRLKDLAAAAAAAPEGEVHLPYLPNAQWRRWRGGALALEPSGDDAHLARLAFAATLPGARGAGEVAAPGCRFTRSGVAAFRRLTTSGEILPRFAPVSVALQDALRAAVPDACLADPRRLADFPVAHALLAYRVSRHARGKVWDTVTWDVLAQWDAPEVLRGLGRALGRQFLACAERVEAGDPALAAKYRALEPRTVLRSLRRNPRRLLTLLQLDNMLVERVRKLASQSARPESPAALCGAVTGAVTAMAKDLRCVFGADLRRLILPCLALAVETAAAAARPRPEPPPAAAPQAWAA